jgi:phospholipase/lecithinase/hemolysin
MTKSTAKSSRTKKKFRETREETADEEISRMNRIIKTNLQKMLNVIVIADIAAAATTISQTASSSSEQTVSITKNRQER